VLGVKSAQPTNLTPPPNLGRGIVKFPYYYVS